MHEKEVLDQPQSNNQLSNEDDFFGEIDNEIINENQEKEPVVNDDNLLTEEESDDKPIKTESEENNEMDYNPLLEALSKEVKYNGESVSIESVEDLKNTYQKGLNYDKMTQKLNDLENSPVFSYVSQKAKELGMSPEKYIDSVKMYEQEQEKQRQQEQIDEMVSQGISEEIAKEVVATAQLRKQLQEEKNLMEKEKQKQEENDKKNREYEEFLKAFPDIKAEDIPKEVFLNAQKSSLKEAYLEYENQEMKKQINILKTNQQNEGRYVGGTSDFGSAKQEKVDPFLEGFDADYD